MAVLTRKIVYFDIETRLSPEKVGWDEARRGGAGISAIAIYSTADGWLHLYDEDSIRGAVSILEAADIVVSYNGAGFDIPAIEGILGRRLHLHAHWDMYLGVKKAIGAGRKKGSGLGPTAERTLGLSKLGEGAHAPALYEEKRFGELFEYCARDVYLLKSLSDHVVEHGYVIGPEGTKLPMRAPSLLKDPNELHN